MFEALLVKPIFNVLTAIYALIPGHDFGVALIIFTILARFAMWPLVKKQVNHTRAIREMQPEVKKIKQKAKGDRQLEATMTMALYKEKEINPMAPLGLLIVQLPILFALFAGIRKIVSDPQTIVDFSYGWVQNLPWMKQVAADISLFDNNLLGIVDLTRKAISGGVYWPALIIVILSCVVQYFASRQISLTNSDSKSIRQLLKETSSTGKQADQAEVSAAVGKLMIYIIPVMTFFISITIAAALSLYWLVGGIVAYLQQRRLLSGEIKSISKTTAKVVSVSGSEEVEAEIINSPKKKKNTKNTRGSRKKKRR